MELHLLELDSACGGHAAPAAVLGRARAGPDMDGRGEGRVDFDHGGGGG